VNTSKSRIRLIAGLGNPGPEYAETRHNAGFWFVDRLAQHFGAVWRSENRFRSELATAVIGGYDVRLLKPQTFMNRSGFGVGGLANYFRIAPEELLVAHDELDLGPGLVRFKHGGGHAGHNGLRDIVAVLGSRDFSRIRIGIGHPGDSAAVVNYVLSKPSLADRKAIESGLDDALDVVEEIVEGEFQKAMNSLHRAARMTPS